MTGVCNESDLHGERLPCYVRLQVLIFHILLDASVDYFEILAALAPIASIMVPSLIDRYESAYSLA